MYSLPSVILLHSLPIVSSVILDVRWAAQRTSYDISHAVISPIPGVQFIRGTFLRYPVHVTKSGN